MVLNGPPECVKRGPILSGVPFPEVLVAKAYSHDGEGMDLVLYPGKEAGLFQLRFEHLLAGRTYELSGTTAIASKVGDAVFEICVDGRTPLTLSARPGS